MTMLTRSLQGETNLLIAPTGSGKTYSIINMLKRVDDLGQIKSIFIVPNSINVEQIKVEYKIPGAWGIYQSFQNLKRQCSCYDLG